jgi:hypothetical protein
MRQILTTLSMKTYVVNGPKKNLFLRLYLARKQVCPDILEETEEDANVFEEYARL